MSDQTIVDVVINDSTATVVDNRDLSNLTIDLNATGQLLTNNLISSGNYLDSEIAIVSGIAQSGSNESLTGQINQLSGNLITTGQTLQTQITSNDSDITSLTSNLVTTGQTLQTQITSNDSDINTLTTNLATTGETLTSEINSISGVVPTGGATNQVLAKINSANYNTQWVDQSGGGGGSGTVTSSTATTNYLTKWTNGAGEVIGNSVAYDNGSNIGIGTATPSSKLHALTSGGSTTSENVVAIFQANTSSAISSGGGTAIKFKGVSSGGNQQNYDQGMISTFGYSTNNMHGMKFYYKPNSSTALTEGMRLNSSGFLSVGGQDASEKLHVHGGNIAVDNTYTIGGVNGSTGLSVSGSALALKTGNVERATISNDKFTIGGTVYSSLATVFNVKDSQDSSFNSGIGVFRSSGAEATYLNMVGGNFNLNAPTGASTQFKVAGTNTLTIVANGNVGIGTTNPSSKLDVNGMISAGIAGDNSANYAALLVSSTGTGTQQSAIAIQQTYPNGNTIIWADLEPYTEYNFSHNGLDNAFTFNSGYYGSSLKAVTVRNRSGTQRTSFEKIKIWQNTATIDVGGSVSIGQLSAGGEVQPTIRLTIKDVQDSSFNSGIALVRSTNTDTAYINVVGGNFNLNAPTGASTQFKVAGTNTLTIVANGNVGIGTATPSSKLHVYGGDAIINTLTIGLGAGSNNSTNTSIGVNSLSNNTIGVQNVAVGYQTLLNNTEGLRNVSIGYQSLYTNTVGDSNISIGYKSLHFNVSGLQNISIGDLSLFNNTGSSNTAVGFSALKSNTSGNGNSSIGFNSLFNNTTGTRNTAQGFEVLYSNTTGSYNVASGYKSIYGNTSGTFNLASGYLSLYANTTGSNNVAVGYQAGRFITDGSTANTTGDYNIFLGTDTKALADNDQNEIVIGYNATGAGSNSATLGNDSITKTVLKGNVGIGTTDPSSKLHVYGGDAIINTLNIGLGAGTNNGANTSIGLSALSSNTSGVNNTAVGEYTLRGNTVGYNNAAFGSRALYNSINGNHNTAIGHYALYSNFSSHSNTAVGLGALRNTNGSNNTAIGFYSLYRNSTGTYNVANGFEAGHYIADGSTPNLTGDYNIFIGSSTKALADNDQNEIVIGYNATGAGSNSVTLGNDSVTKTILKGAVEFKVSGSNTFAVATNGSISSSTGASLSSGGTWTDASTRELKQDIKDLDYRESLNIIKQLNPVKFAYKKDPKNKKIGFIAEDVPDLVATEDRKGLSALQIVSALTKVVQSQQKEIQQLKRMVKRLNKIK